MTYAEHQQRAVELEQWIVSLWWMGWCCLLFVAGLLVADMPRRAAVAMLLFLGVAACRALCTRSWEEHIAESIHEHGEEL